MNAIEAINSKRAVRDFTQQRISDDDLRTILNAGRRSGSAKNMQPWHFIVVRERERLKALSKTGTYAGHIAGANLAIAIVSVPFTNRWSIMFDIGRAAQNMMLTAWALGIGSVMGTVYQPDDAQALLGFPDEFEINCAISFGYPQNDPRQRPPRKDARRPFDNVVHFERW